MKWYEKEIKGIILRISGKTRLGFYKNMVFRKTSALEI